MSCRNMRKEIVIKNRRMKIRQRKLFMMTINLRLSIQMLMITLSSLILPLILTTLTPTVTADPNFPLLSGTLKTFQVHACDGEELKLECTENTIIAISLVQYGLPIFNTASSASSAGTISSQPSPSINACANRNGGDGKMRGTQTNNLGRNNHHQSLSPPQNSRQSLSHPRNSVPANTAQNFGSSSLSKSSSSTSSSASSSSLINGNNSNCISETLRYQLLQKVESSCRGKSVCTILTAPSSFGGIDPCPGTIKLIEVAYKCRPNTFPSKVSCEGDTMRLKCRQSSDRIAILSAFYGWTSTPVPECPPLTTSFNQPPSTSPAIFLPSSSTSSMLLKTSQQQQLRNNLTADEVAVAQKNASTSGDVCQASFATESVMSRCLAHSSCNISVNSETFVSTPGCKRDGMRFHLKVIYACVTGRVLRNYSPSSSFPTSTIDGQKVVTGDYSGFVDAPRYDPSQENVGRKRIGDGSSIEEENRRRIWDEEEEERKDINLHSSFDPNVGGGKRRGEEIGANSGHRHVTIQPDPILVPSSKNSAAHPSITPSSSSSSSQRTTNSPLDSSSAISTELTRTRGASNWNTLKGGGGERRENESSSFLSSSSSEGVKGVMTTRLEAIGSLDTSSSSTNGSTNRAGLDSGVSSKDKITNPNESNGRKVVSFAFSIYNLFKAYSEEVMLFILMVISASCLMASLVFLTMMMANKRSLKRASGADSSPKECSVSLNDSSTYDPPVQLPPATITTTGHHHQHHSILKRSESSNLKYSQQNSTSYLQSSPSKRANESNGVFDVSNEQLLDDLHSEGLVRSPTLMDYKREDKYGYLGNQMSLYQMDPINSGGDHHTCVQELNCANLSTSDSITNRFIHNSHSLHHLNSYCNGNNTYGGGVNMVYPLNHYPSPSTSSTPVSNCTSNTTNSNSNHSHNLQLDLVQASSLNAHHELHVQHQQKQQQQHQQLVFPSAVQTSSPFNSNSNHRDSTLIPILVTNTNTNGNIIGGTLNRRRNSSRIAATTPLFPIATTSFALTSSNNTTSFNSPSKGDNNFCSTMSNVSPLKQQQQISDGSNGVTSNVIHDNNGINVNDGLGVVGGGGSGSTLQRIVIGNENRDGHEEHQEDRF